MQAGQVYVARKKLRGVLVDTVVELPAPLMLQHMKWTGDIVAAKRHRLAPRNRREIRRLHDNGVEKLFGNPARNFRSKDLVKLIKRHMYIIPKDLKKKGDEKKEEEDEDGDMIVLPPLLDPYPVYPAFISVGPYKVEIKPEGGARVRPGGYTKVTAEEQRRQLMSALELRQSKASPVTPNVVTFSLEEPVEPSCRVVMPVYEEEEEEQMVAVKMEMGADAHPQEAHAEEQELASEAQEPAQFEGPTPVALLRAGQEPASGGDEGQEPVPVFVMESQEPGSGGDQEVGDGNQAMEVDVAPDNGGETAGVKLAPLDDAQRIPKPEPLSSQASKEVVYVVAELLDHVIKANSSEAHDS